MSPEDILTIFQHALQVVTLMFAGPWMLRLIMEYTQQLIQDIPYLVG